MTKSIGVTATDDENWAPTAVPFGELFDSYEQMAQKCPCSGPAPLLDAVTGHCDSWPSGALHIERFAAKDLEEPGRAEGSRWS